jgi:hypothetical protein
MGSDPVESIGLRRHVLAILLLTIAAVSPPVLSQVSTDTRRRFITDDEARPTLELLAQLRPAELKALDEPALRKVWTEWVARADAEIRARVAGGEDDSVVNLLLFGTSFTSQPRITARHLEEAVSAPDPAAQIDRIVDARLDDFLNASAKPSGNERLAFVAERLKTKGIALTTASGRTAARTYMLKELARVLAEIGGYEATAKRAQALGDPSAEFAQRSKIYERRGLSSDTTLAPNFALESALREMKAKGLIRLPIRRVAVVGPGLDFVDKQEGFDFYPPQSLQPFMLLDSLLRLKLSQPGDLHVVTFDVNPKVNAHLLRVRSLPKTSYTLHLPLDADEPWSAPFLNYWRSAGDQIGKSESSPRVPPNAGNVSTRTVVVGAQWVAKLEPVDVNVIVQRLDLPPSETFDLVVATNTFVYYNEFQQSLAMANVASMLKPGGIFLSNNAVVELPSGPVRSAGTTTVSYSARPVNGDVVIWYLR